MAIRQFRSKRKISGGRYRAIRKSRLRELGNLPTHTRLGKRKAKRVRVRGRNYKVKVLSTEFANVYDPKTKKTFRVKVETIIDHPANRHFIRRNIVTKSAIIKTEKGNARITSRPGQHGTINAVLIEK
jgi:small subunit ribosomal protein S8e